MNRIVNNPKEHQNIYFWTEKQLGEFLRQAGEDAEKRERAERESREIVFVRPEKPERTPRKPKAAKKVKEPSRKTPRVYKSPAGLWESHDAKYVGHTFGSLHVLRYVHSEGGRRWYACHCDICGKNVVRSNKHFNGGRVMSCGCLARENHRLRSKKSSRQNAKVLESSE